MKFVKLAAEQGALKVWRVLHGTPHGLSGAEYFSRSTLVNQINKRARRSDSTRRRSSSDFSGHL